MRVQSWLVLCCPLERNCLHQVWCRHLQTFVMLPFWGCISLIPLKSSDQNHLGYCGIHGGVRIKTACWIPQTYVWSFHSLKDFFSVMVSHTFVPLWRPFGCRGTKVACVFYSGNVLDASLLNSSFIYFQANRVCKRNENAFEVSCENWKEDGR